MLVSSLKGAQDEEKPIIRIQCATKKDCVPVLLFFVKLCIQKESVVCLLIALFLKGHRNVAKKRCGWAAHGCSPLSMNEPLCTPLAQPNVLGHRETENIQKGLLLLWTT